MGEGCVWLRWESSGPKGVVVRMSLSLVRKGVCGCVGLLQVLGLGLNEPRKYEPRAYKPRAYEPRAEYFLVCVLKSRVSQRHLYNYCQ